MATSTVRSWPTAALCQIIGQRDDSAWSRAVRLRGQLIGDFAARHRLAQNDFKSAASLFKEAPEASAKRNCDSMRGEIARDYFTVSLVNRRLTPRDHEKPFRHMLAHGAFDGMCISFENTAKGVAECFLETLYKPFPGYPPKEISFNLD